MGRVSVPLPVLLFTSAPLVRATGVASASLSENKRGLKTLKKHHHCRAVEAIINHTTINQLQSTQHII